MLAAARSLASRPSVTGGGARGGPLCRPGGGASGGPGPRAGLPRRRCWRLAPVAVPVAVPVPPAPGCCGVVTAALRALA
eukprot:9136509-Lingulodinium_polyedra.AAC.1